MIEQATADTLNKALDLAKQGVVSAFETVKQYAPYVWSMARRQVWLEGIELGVVWAVFFGLWSAINITSYRSYLRYKATNGREGWEGEEHAICFWISTGVFVVLTLMLIPDAMDLIFNPDYWTMRKILTLVGK